MKLDCIGRKLKVNDHVSVPYDHNWLICPTQLIGKITRLGTKYVYVRLTIPQHEGDTKGHVEEIPVIPKDLCKIEDSFDLLKYLITRD